MKPIHLQKATKFNSEKHSKIIRGWGIQRKIDGVRVQILVDDGEVSIFARAIADKLGDFNNYTEHLPHVVDYIKATGLLYTRLDGEACVFAFDNDNENCSYVSGTLNMLPENAVERQAEQHPIQVVLFDMPDMDVPYQYRYETLCSMFEVNAGFKTDKRPVTVNPMTINKDVEYLEEYNRIVDEGGEGIVLYNLKGMYKHGARCQVNKELLKIKEVNEKEVLAIGRERGIESGWCSDLVGALICQDERGKVFRVGSGMTAEQRESLRDVELPCVIEITYNAMTEDSYRLPIFRRLRTDKDINDWTQEGVEA